MADPERVTVTASVFAIITAAIQSTNALKETVQRFKQRNKTLGRLQNGLEDLSRTLFILRQMVDTDASVLALLQGPIEQCSRLCREFEDSMKAFDTRSKTGFQDWAGMKFMAGDIDEFIDTLAGYKSTISIGLCTITIS
ncbi:hypothetical protein ASPCAL12344 [Aspergillus calidoustus]|uniref:Azaphilone pigments biosynthesis cluster protein L N-terminal domain-containing protein n=1 Tax=Aspergillus calidoustus TaxID=454130 RepID=A0A0U4ZHR4_ASPCI|nr:hypothetical protein ASPCAL12344 [Aspergillus calidoustus]